MSYSEQNGQVTLTMSQEDYEMLLMLLGYAVGSAERDHRTPRFKLDRISGLLNRLNQGNPNYTPYQVEEKK